MNLQTAFMYRRTSFYSRGRDQDSHILMNLLTKRPRISMNKGIGALKRPIFIRTLAKFWVKKFSNSLSILNLILGHILWALMWSVHQWSAVRQVSNFLALIWFFWLYFENEIVFGEVIYKKNRKANILLLYTQISLFCFQTNFKKENSSWRHFKDTHSCSNNNVTHHFLILILVKVW